MHLAETSFLSDWDTAGGTGTSLDPEWGDVGNSTMQHDAGRGPSSTNPVKELKQSFRQEHFFSHLLQLEQDEPNQLDPLHAECSPGLPCSLTLLSFPSKLSLYSKLFLFVCLFYIACIGSDVYSRSQRETETLWASSGHMWQVSL